MHEAGDLDTSFGVDGQVLLEIIPGEDHFEPKMVLLPDDSILVAGGCGNAEMFCLARFKPDGTLDTSFGAPNGYVTTDIVSGEDDSPRDVVVQPDGKILMIGDCIDAVQRICMVRYNENGTLDTSFGAPDGYVIFGYHPGDDDEGESLALQSNGQIIVAGECDFDNYICVSRRNSDGSEDATFNGGAGFTEINPSAGDDDEDPEVILQSDGKIVIAASCDDRDDVCVARFNADGTVDNSFGGAGVNWTRTPILGGFNYVEEVAITTGGRILVAGECNDVNYFCLLAYTSSGVLDTAFNGDGILLADVAPDWNAAYGLAVQADGKIILSGGCREGAHTCLLRVEADGDIDTDFGDDGWVIYKFTDEDDVGQDVIVQSDGKIIASSDCQDFTAFCLARFYGEDVPFSTGVTGGSISDGRGRLDFDMQETLDKQQVTAALNRIIAEDHPMSMRWITDEELAELRSLLESFRENGECFYGVHQTSEAIVTCMVHNPMAEDGHVHFIDAHHGGYAMAAAELKSQMKKSAGTP